MRKKIIPVAISVGLCFPAVTAFASDSGQNQYDEAYPSRVNLEYASPESNADELINDQTWWKSWASMKDDLTLTESQVCASLSGNNELNTKQQIALNEGCVELVFLDTFNNEEGTNLAPIENVPNIDGVVQLKKWYVTGAPGVTVRKGSTPTVNDTANPQSYSVLLGQTTTNTTGFGTAKLTTKGPLTLTKGKYVLSFKVKDRTGTGTTAKFAGVKAEVIGKHYNYAEKSHVIQTTPNSFRWSTAILEFDVKNTTDDVYISLENIYNGKNDEPAIIDMVVLHKKSNELY